jgi:hypothetical protein
MNKVNLLEIKQALLNDGRFRESLPSLKDEINKFIQNPGCPSCSLPLVRKIVNQYPEVLKEYFAGREIVNEAEEIKKIAENHWLVINCHVDKLEERLRSLPPGRKQIAVARFEDQVTVVVNELDQIW